jgi:CPA2 family monovalent cation:H+ antiporter-2
MSLSEQPLDTWTGSGECTSNGLLDAADLAEAGRAVTPLLLEAFIYLLAAVVAVPLAGRFGLGSVLGYLVAGVVIGPVLGLVGSEESVTIQHYAEFGVVMMLFLVGLELEPAMLWRMRNRLLGLGGLQVR